MVCVAVCQARLLSGLVVLCCVDRRVKGCPTGSKARPVRTWLYPTDDSEAKVS
jgi:hypothetical protein